MDQFIARSIKVLAFDVFGTVVDWRSSVITEGEQLGKAKGITVDWAAFADAWHDLYRPALNRVLDGRLSWTKLDQLHRMSLEQILRRFGIDGLSEEEIVHLNLVWHRLAPWPDAVPGLQRLKTCFTVVTLSNGNIGLLTEMAKHAALPWDCILSAENVRRYKPDPVVYRLVPEIFGLKPEQVMLVAAHEYDLHAAKQEGLLTGYVHRPLEYGPQNTSDIPPAGRYDVIARDILELAQQLGA